MTEPVTGEKLKSVFISYARRGGSVMAETLWNRLTEVGFSVWRDIEEIELGEVWYREIREGIENCATLILCLTAEAIKSEIVLQEWTYARKLGKRIISIKDENLNVSDIPLVFAKFNWINDLERDWARFIIQLETPYIPKPYQREESLSDTNKPEHVPRPALMNAIKQRLLERKSPPKSNDNRKPPMLIALIGSGGQGKTTLAKDVLADKTVRMMFDAGYALREVEFGTEFNTDDVKDIYAKKQKKLGDLICALSGHPQSTLMDIEGLRRQLYEIINNDFCLILLDNVWDAAHIEDFLVDGERHVYLITTRSHEVAQQLGIPPHLRISVGDMTETEAVKVLSHNFSLQEVTPLTENFRALARQLSCHPLLLKLGRVMIQQTMSHREPSLEAALLMTETLYRERGITGLDRENDIQVSVELSIDALEKALREKFFSFAILKENTAVPLAVFALYWGGDVQQAVDICIALHNRSLLTYEFDMIKFHDVLFSYLKVHAPDHKLLHKRYLDALNPERRLPWHTLSADAKARNYVEDRLVYHLEQAGDIDAIHSLFESEQWANKRDLFGLFRDYRHAKRLATDDATRIRYLFFDEAIQKQYPDVPSEVVIELIRRRLLGDEAAGVLIQSIKGMSGDNTAKLKTYVEAVPNLREDVRPEVLADALKFLKSESLPPEVAASAIQDLIGMLPPKTDLTDWLTVYWNTLLKIDTRDARNPYINHVLSLDLTETQKKFLLTTSLELLKGDDYDRVSDDNIKVCIAVLETLLIDYSPTTRDAAWQRVIDMLSKMSTYSSRENLWVRLLPLLPRHLQDACGEMVWEVLRDLMQWERHEFFEDIFVPLIKYLPVHRIDEALKRANKESDFWRDLARSHLLSLQRNKGISQSEEKIEEIQLETEHYQEYSSLAHFIGRIEALLMDDAAKHYDQYQYLWNNFVRYVHSTTKDDINEFDVFAGYFPPEILIRLWDISFLLVPNKHLLGLTGLIPYVDLERARELFWLRMENDFKGEYYPMYLSKILARFAKRLTSTEKLQLWDDIMGKFGDTQDWQRQFPIVELYGQLSAEHQQLKAEQVRTFINNISDDSSRVRLICEYIKENAIENNKILWWIALENSLKQKNSSMGGVIGLLPFFYSMFDETELNKLKAIDWDSEAWKRDRLFDGLVNSIDDFYSGLGLFILNAPQDFVERIIPIYISYGHCPALIALAAATRLSDEKRERYIRGSVEKYREDGQHMEELYRLPIFLKSFSKKDVLGLWSEICELYKSAEEKFKYQKFLEYFTQIFPSPKLLEIGRMALRNEAPTEKPDLLLQSIVKLLTPNDTVIAIQLWREIEEYEKTLKSSYEAREYRTARMMLIPLLPDEILFQSIKAKPMLSDGAERANSFTYRLDRYFREPLLGSEKYGSQLAETVNRLKMKGYDFYATAFGFFLFISTSLSYLTLPLIFLYQVSGRFLKIAMVAIVKFLRLDAVAKIYVSQLDELGKVLSEKYVSENNRGYNDYKYYPLHIKIILLIIGAPYVFIIFISETTKIIADRWNHFKECNYYRGVYSVRDKIWRFIFKCQDAFGSLFISYDYRHHISFYSIPRKRAREILESMIAKKEPAVGFAERRSLLQRLGGWRLRHKAGKAYHDSVTWWDAATRRTLVDIKAEQFDASLSRD